MLEDALDYQWARNRLVQTMVEIWPQMAGGYADVEPLVRAGNLSQKISGLVAHEEFDRVRANLFFAREVAYWREWIAQRERETDEWDDSGRLAVLEMGHLIDEYSRFEF